MRKVGISRRIDELGRIVVPKEMRRELGICDKDELDIYVEGDSIVLKKKTTACIFCNQTENLHVVKEKFVCVDCIDEIK